MLATGGVAPPNSSGAGAPQYRHGMGDHVSNITLPTAGERRPSSIADQVVHYGAHLRSAGPPPRPILMRRGSAPAPVPAPPRGPPPIAFVSGKAPPLYSGQRRRSSSVSLPSEKPPPPSFPPPFGAGRRASYPLRAGESLRQSRPPPPRGPPPRPAYPQLQGASSSSLVARASGASMLATVSPSFPPVTRRPSYSSYQPLPTEEMEQVGAVKKIHVAPLPYRRYSMTQEAVPGPNLSRRLSASDSSSFPAPWRPPGQAQGITIPSSAVNPDAVKFYNDGVRHQKGGDYAAAVEMYCHAASLGHPRAQHNLAAMYEKGGMGVDKDDAEAVRLFQLAASAGLDESCYSLAMHYKIGLGCEKDDSKCVHYLEEASVNGLAKAMFNLGLMYEKRRGISPDVPMEELLVAAKDCYSAAAAAGVHKAAVNLGVLYLTGRLPASGPEEERQNQVEAFRCFKLAADAGDVSAMYNLALCYEKGIGAEKDYAAAEALKQAAARHEAIRQGQALQEISVAALQQSGLPVMKDVSGADPESAEESRPPRPSGPLPDQMKRRSSSISVTQMPSPAAIARVRAAVEARHARERQRQEMKKGITAAT